jgi:hypothetical protein
VRVLAYKAIKLFAAPLLALFVVAQVGLCTKPERMYISSMPFTDSDEVNDAVGPHWRESESVLAAGRAGTTGAIVFTLDFFCLECWVVKCQTVAAAVSWVALISFCMVVSGCFQRLYVIFCPGNASKTRCLRAGFLSLSRNPTSPHATAARASDQRA